MSNNLGGSVIQLSLRGDTLARWTELNPVLNDRELVVETDTRRFKIGDGTSAYLALAYAGTSARKELAVVVVAGNLELSAGSYFSKTVTTTTALTLSNLEPAGYVNHFTLRLINAGSRTFTWFAGIRWPEGVLPVLTVSLLAPLLLRVAAAVAELLPQAYSLMALAREPRAAFSNSNSVMGRRPAQSM